MIDIWNIFHCVFFQAARTHTTFLFLWSEMTNKNQAAAFLLGLCGTRLKRGLTGIRLASWALTNKWPQWYWGQVYDEAKVIWLKKPTTKLFLLLSPHFLSFLLLDWFLLGQHQVTVHAHWSNSLQLYWNGSAQCAKFKLIWDHFWLILTHFLGFQKGPFYLLLIWKKLMFICFFENLYWCSKAL